MKPLLYEPGDLNYVKPNPFSNPFAKRRLASETTLSRGSAQCRVSWEAGYGLRYYNQSSIFEERRLRNRLKLNPNPQRKISWVEDAAGNDLRSEFLLGRLLSRIISDCRRNPMLFQGHVLRLRQALNFEGIEIAFVEAFERISSFQELLGLLESIAQKPGAFQFELAAAALVQYATKHY